MVVVLCYHCQSSCNSSIYHLNLLGYHDDVHAVAIVIIIIIIIVRQENFV
jgi:hypothetical protein